jgi:Zn-dependent protease with chaperone function
MLDWQHVLAGGLFASAIFMALCGVSALLGAAVWRMRAWLDLKQVKRLLAALLLLPLSAICVLPMASHAPPCGMQIGCYLCWMQQHVGEASILVLRMVIMLVLAVLLVWLYRLACGAAIGFRALRDLQRVSSPPSQRLRKTLYEVVPVEWHGRFREAEMPAEASGVYGGTCFLSRTMVQEASESQLRAIVMHEWQHLRARDGWFALVAGLLANSVGMAWSVLYRYWIAAAELLADENAVRGGIRRRDLARALLQHQVNSQAMAPQFAASSHLLEERLRHLLYVYGSAPPRRSSWLVWSIACVIIGLLQLLLWQSSAAASCAVHCAIF